MADKREIKAVVFDYGGVIAPSPIPIFQAFEAQTKLPVGTIVRLVVNQLSQSAWKKLETGAITFLHFLGDFQQEIKLLTGKSVDTRLLANLLASRASEPYPVIIDAIRCLRAEGFKVALLTNNWYIGSKSGENSQFDASLFDVIVESRLEGVSKPDPEIYKLCQQRLGVSPTEIVFLDDLGQNLKMARILGWHTIKVTNAEKAVVDLENQFGIQLRGFIAGTISVPKHLQLNITNLRQYISTASDVSSNDKLIARSFEHGQSNPTYVIQYGDHKLVLRKKPPGDLLPSAHAVDREYRVMKAVREQGVPVPKMLSFCNNNSILGTPFYLMEYLPGRVFKSLANIDISPAEVTDLHHSMIDVLCKLHSVNITEAGLDNFGKKGGFIQRNFKRWSQQYEASKTKEIDAINKLMEWIPKHFPKDERVTIVHGDFRIDNLMYAKDSAEVLGVLDWELSTLGDPISDLVTCCLFHYMSPSSLLLPGFAGIDLKSKGIPTVEEILERYCRQMNVPSINNWNFYVAFTFFKMAAVLQGVYKRGISGQGSSARAKFAGQVAEDYAELGWNIANGSNLLSTKVPIPNIVSKSSRNTMTMMSYISRPLSSKRSHGTVGEMPVSVEGLSPRVQDLHRRVKNFITEHIAPIESDIHERSMGPDKWTVHPKVTELKRKARKEGLSNLFLPIESDTDQRYGAGLSNIEYAFFCEEMGKVPISSSIFNCNAPDTGNMEVLVRYGTEEQKKKWLIPLLNGEIRSCFGMTEPEVASSDATNIQSSIRREGDEYVINGHKWWTSNALHPDCKVCIFMGKTATTGSKHRQQSMILVPMDAPGVKIVRPLTVFGYDHAPGGHAEVIFDNVRVPVSNILLGEGRGFEIAQGRLGPGRIHHCMRVVGIAERALALMLERTKSRIAFGKPLAMQGTIQADVAQSRIEIEQTRLLVLKAAYMMDLYGNKVAAPEISMIKVAAPSMLQNVLDRAIQVHGGAGVSDDFPLAAFFAQNRTLRFADGPDEVHRRSIARMEYAKSTKSSL